jgi:hypothetical protein
VADAVWPDRAIPAVHTLPATWSAEASARCEEKVSQKQFMRLMMAAWASHTHLESAAVALLASRGCTHRVGLASSFALYCLSLQEAQAGDVLSGARGRQDIRKTVGLRLYSDGENQHLDGSGHWGWVAFWVTKTMAVGRLQVARKPRCSGRVSTDQ